MLFDLGNASLDGSVVLIAGNRVQFDGRLKLRLGDFIDCLLYGKDCFFGGILIGGHPQGQGNRGQGCAVRFGAFYRLVAGLIRAAGKSETGKHCHKRQQETCKFSFHLGILLNIIAQTKNCHSILKYFTRFCLICQAIFRSRRGKTTLFRTKPFTHRAHFL